MTPIVWTYLSYLAISIAMTVWVAKTLHKNGRIFLIDSFGGNVALADSINHLLWVGFYLINIGYVALALRETQEPDRPARRARTSQPQSRSGLARARRDALL